MGEPFHYHSLGCRTGKGGLAGEHLIEQAPERVDIAPPVQLRLARGLLGAHIVRSAQREPGLRQAVSAVPDHGAGDAEVGHERMTGGEQDIPGREIAVHDTSGMGVALRVGDLGRESNRVVQRQRRFPADPVPQGLPFHVRHGEPQELAGLAGVVQRKDVRVGQAGDDSISRRKSV